MTRPPSSETFAFLVRLWPVWSNGQLLWRASLTLLPEGEPRGFASFDELCLYLANLLRSHTERKEVDEENQYHC